MKHANFDMDLTIDDTEIEANVSLRYSPPAPARVNCLPEDAAPAEDGEIEILDITTDEKINLMGRLDDVCEQIEEWFWGKEF